MTELNIFTGSSLQVREDESSALVEYLEQPRSRSISIKIDISRSTANYLDMILDIIGAEYDNRINILQDSDSNFGQVIVKEVNTFSSTPKMIEYKVFELLYFANNYKFSDLQSAITMESPSFLIMNNYTWSILNSKDGDNVDEYDTMGNKAYYKSYYKVPVAICEFIANNTINVIS